MITRNFNLYLNAGHSVPLVINVNQYDSGEQWVFTLYNADGTQYTPSTGAIVGIKSDGFGIINSGSVVDGNVVINETQQMTAAVGKAVFELMIDSQTHGTANFIVLVEEKPGNNADLSESDLSLLQEAIDATSPLPTGGTVGQVLTKTASGSTWSNAGTPTQEQVADAVSDWADEHITVSTGVVIDTSLSVAGAAADAKKTGDEITDLKSAIEEIEQGGGALSNQAKTALFNCLSAALYNTADSDELISALREALYSNYVAVTGLSLSYSTLTLEVGETLKLIPTITPNNASDKSVRWATSNASILSVADDGTVTAVSEGLATVSCTTNDGNYVATCSVDVQEAVVTYTVTNTLTNCFNSNASTEVNENSSYSGTITAAESYRLTSVTVTMGGTDITSTAYNDGVISIASVTGNLVITATATVIANILQNTVVTTGKYLKTNDGTIANSGTEFVTDDIDISEYAGQVILIDFIGCTYSLDAYRFAFYDSSNTFIECKYNGLTKLSYEVPSNAKYMKLGGKYAGMTGITVSVAKNSITPSNLISGGYYDMADATIKSDSGYSHALLDMGACWAKVINCSSFVSLDSNQGFISAGSGNHNTGNISPNSAAVYVGMNVLAANVSTATCYGSVDYQIGNLAYSA